MKFSNYIPLQHDYYSGELASPGFICGTTEGGLGPEHECFHIYKHIHVHVQCTCIYMYMHSDAIGVYWYNIC